MNEPTYKLEDVIYILVALVALDVLRLLGLLLLLLLLPPGLPLLLGAGRVKPVLGLGRRRQAKIAIK